LHANIQIASFYAMRLGAGDGHDQGCDTEHYQEQAGK
jgi:hypothetical protein